MSTLAMSTLTNVDVTQLYKFHTLLFIKINKNRLTYIITTENIYISNGVLYLYFGIKLFL